MSGLDLGRHEGASTPDLLLPDGATSSDPLGDITEGLKAWFQAGISLGKSIDAQTDEIHKLWNKLQQDTPVIGRRVGSAICPTPTAPFVISLGKPEEGTYWEVIGYVIGGTEQNVTAAGTAGMYISGLDTVNGAGMINMVDQANSLPDISYTGTGQCVVQAGEHLFNVVFGGTAGQTYVANARFRVFNVAGAGGKTEFTA